MQHPTLDVYKTLCVAILGFDLMRTERHMQSVAYNGLPFAHGCLCTSTV